MMQPDLFASPQPVDTRAAAHAFAAERAPELQKRILKYMTGLAERGGKGLTADECASNLGLSILSVRPRFTELVKAGRLTDTGRRRQNKSGRSAKVFNVNPETPRSG